MQTSQLPLAAVASNL